MNQVQFLKKWLFAIILVINYPVNGKILDASSVPIDPISAIIDAFNTYKVVALDEGNHGNEQSHNFRIEEVVTYGMGRKIKKDLQIKHES